ncbi:hypothetical protein OC844_003572 [Tilletia horrida]|nr:hypothetical protein OC844_003572 [Tilletia horrida]
MTARYLEFDGISAKPVAGVNYGYNTIQWVQARNISNKDMEGLATFLELQWTAQPSADDMSTASTLALK